MAQLSRIQSTGPSYDNQGWSESCIDAWNGMNVHLERHILWTLLLVLAGLALFQCPTRIGRHLQIFRPLEAEVQESLADRPYRKIFGESLIYHDERFVISRCAVRRPPNVSGIRPGPSAKLELWTSNCYPQALVPFKDK